MSPSTDDPRGYLSIFGLCSRKGSGTQAKYFCMAGGRAVFKGTFSKSF